MVRDLFEHTGIYGKALNEFYGKWLKIGLNWDFVVRVTNLSLKNDGISSTSE
jgi:hypothetical protein